MVLGDVNRTRNMAGAPSVENVSDAEITTYLGFGTSRVIAVTGKTDWETDTTHTEYNSAVMAAEYFADVAIRDRFGDKDDVSTEHWDRAMAILTQVQASIEGGGDGGAGGGGAGGSTIGGVYKTYPLNPSISPYRSISPTSQYLGEDVVGPRA
jgi:hypothetical protein